MVLLNRKPLKKQKVAKNFWNFFPKNVSDKSHSAKIRKESSMIAKRLVSGKNREIGGGFNENKLEKARGTKKNSDLWNSTYFGYNVKSSDIACWAIEET